MSIQLKWFETDEMTRNRVVIGCNATKTRGRLIQEGSDLTLKIAIDIATSDEMSKVQLESMACENATVNSKNQQKQKPGCPPKKHPVKECHECVYRHDNKKCFAEGKRCNKCRKLNHFARVCQSKPHANKGIHCLAEEYSEEQLFLNVLL